MYLEIIGLATLGATKYVGYKFVRAIQNVRAFGRAQQIEKILRNKRIPAPENDLPALVDRVANSRPSSDLAGFDPIDPFLDRVRSIRSDLHQMERFSTSAPKRIRNRKLAKEQERPF